MIVSAGQIDRVLAEYGSPHSTATIGRVELKPGAANVIPGEAVFSLDVRDTDSKTLEILADAFRRTLSAIARRRDLMFEFSVLSDIAPVQCDTSVVSAVDAAVNTLQLPATHLNSCAAHDAQIIAGIAPTGMIFVPSKAGRSHSAASCMGTARLRVTVKTAPPSARFLAKMVPPYCSTIL